MAYRDRLAQSRAQRGQAVELSPVANGAQSYPPAPQPAGNVSDLSSFLAEDESIQTAIQRVRDNVALIGHLRSRSLNSIQENEAELSKIDELTTETRSLVQDLKNRIKRLESAPAQPGDVQLRKNRITLLRNKFMDVLRDYQREEQDSRAEVRTRVERQYKIVKQDATPQEINDAIEGGGQQIFAQALSTSTRYGESRTAYNEAMSRQQELRKVEQTLAELAQLFQDMAILVEEQDVVIKNVHDAAVAVNTDMEQGLVQTSKAVEHARAARRKRWICFGIFIFVIAVLALVLGLYFGVAKKS